MFRRILIGSVALLGMLAPLGFRGEANAATTTAKVQVQEVKQEAEAGAYSFRVDIYTVYGWEVDSYHRTYVSAVYRSDYMNDLGYDTRIVSIFEGN
jgi:hypothetical protein